MRGKAVLLNLWATWCGPCRTELPDFRSLHQKFARQGLVILAVSGEERSILKKFAAENDMRFPILEDPADQVKGRFLVSGVPQSFVYNRSGKIVGHATDRLTMTALLAMLKVAGLQ
jgi:peroxiredoxin